MLRAKLFVRDGAAEVSTATDRTDIQTAKSMTPVSFYLAIGLAPPPKINSTVAKVALAHAETLGNMGWTYDALRKRFDRRE